MQVDFETDVFEGIVLLKVLRPSAFKRGFELMCRLAPPPCRVRNLLYELFDIVPVVEEERVASSKRRGYYVITSKRSGWFRERGMEGFVRAEGQQSGGMDRRCE